MSEINFQGVFDKLQEVLPASWDKIIFYVFYTPGSYSMKYYIKDGAETIDCFNQPGVNRMQLIKVFMAIDGELAPVRKSLTPAETWNAMTIIVDGSGNMETHFDYTDVSENTIEYTRAWEERYLK